MIKGERLAYVLIEVTDALIDDADRVEFLRLITTRSALIGCSPWAGVLLASPQGQLQLTASSAESATLSALFEPGTAEGPWLDCLRTGSPVVNIDLTQPSDRWPVHMSQTVVSAGFRTASALPLRASKNVIGALTLFSPDLKHLTPRDVRSLQALADLTTIGLRQGAPTRWAFNKQPTSAQPHPDRAADADPANPADPADPADRDLIAAGEPRGLLKPAEVATMFHVNPRTVTKWANSGRLTAIRTLGGHRRYRHAEVDRLLTATETSFPRL